MRRFRLLLALAATGGLVGPAVAAEPGGGGLRGAAPVLRRFAGGRIEGWILACDNTRICRAQPVSSDGSLMVRRDPGPDGSLLVVLDGQDPSAGPSMPDPASIRVAGAGRLAPAPWRLDRAAESARLEGAAALRFVRAIADAQTLTYRAGGEERTVPLRGMKAALLAMDVAQGRTNGVTAFTRIGPRTRAQVLPALPVPVLHVPRPPVPAALPASFAARVRQASRRLLARAGCEPAPRNPALAFALNRTEAIVLMECSYGPTIVSYLLVRARRADPRRVRRILLPRLPGEDENFDPGNPLYPFAEWDPATASLTTMSWSCAHTCGENGRWVFDGRSFVVAEHMIYQGGGAEVLDLYRTEVRLAR